MSSSQPHNNHGDDDQIKDLLKIAEWLVNKTNELSSRSVSARHETIPDKINCALLRSYPDTPEAKQFKSQIVSWSLNFSSKILDNEHIWIPSLKKFVSYCDMADEICRQMPEFHTKKFVNDLSYVESLATRAIKFDMSNCGEKSAIAFILGIEYPQQGFPHLNLPPINKKVRIERVRYLKTYNALDYTTNDHAFVILNRDINTDLNNISTWNDDAIICDPWKRQYYTKKDLMSRHDGINKNVAIVAFDPCIREDYFLGEQHNKNIHTPDWETKHRQSTHHHKFWRPNRLSHLNTRPSQIENLPISLENAAKQGNIPYFSKISDAGYDLIQDDNCFEIAFSLAIESNQIELVNFFLTNGATVYVRHLDLAINKNHVEMLTVLLKSFADYENGAKQNLLSNLLKCAIQADKIDVIEYLITQQVNIHQFNDTNETLSPLLYAFAKNKFEIAKCLIKHGVDVNQCDENDMTPLVTAALDKNYEIFNLLIECGANVNQQCEPNGITVLNALILNNDLELIQFLVKEKNADLKIKQANGDNILRAAVFSNRLEIVKFLVASNPALINEVNEEKMTALHLAIKKGYFEIVKYLVEIAKADISLANEGKLNAIELSKTAGNPVIKEYFEQLDQKNRSQNRI